MFQKRDPPVGLLIQPQDARRCLSPFIGRVLVRRPVFPVSLHSGSVITRPPAPTAEPDAAVAHAPFRSSLLPRTTRRIPAARLRPPPWARPSGLPARVSERPRPRALRADWLRCGGGQPVGAHTLLVQPMGVSASLTGRPASRQPLNKPHCCTKLLTQESRAAASNAESPSRKDPRGRPGRV